MDKAIGLAVIDSGVSISSIPLMAENIIPLEIRMNQEKFELCNSIYEHNEHGNLVIHRVLQYVQEPEQVMIYSFRVLNQNLNCNLAELQYVLNYIYDKAEIWGIRVINMSLGYHEYSEEMHEIIKKLYAKKIFILAAFDNNSDNSYPANHKEVLGVKGMNVLYMDKSRDYCYDTAKNELCTYNKLVRISKTDGSYGYIGGNSMACASASGIVIDYLLKYHTYEKVMDKLEADGININELEDLRIPLKHKENENILFFPLSERNINSIKNSKKFCRIVGFLDFRTYLFHNIEDDMGNIYPIYNDLTVLSEKIDCIYVDELYYRDHQANRQIFIRILDQALRNKVNLSFYERPEEKIFKEFLPQFKKHNLFIEYRNIFD